jgi:type II secretory pathway predicted ATPase ExeA
VTDPRDRRPLADDAAFMARLSDLDRDLIRKAFESEAAETSSVAVKTEPPNAAFPLGIPPPPPAPSPFAAFPGEAPQEPVHRPLHNLFPPEMLDAGPSSSAPHPVSAPPPPQPPPAVRARPPRAAVTPQAPAPRPAAPERPAAPPRAPVAPPPPVDVSDAPTYETFYGLHEKPFSLSTDPKFLYHSTPHDRVAQELLTAIRRRETLAVLTGDIGAGKTTLCRAIVDQLDRRTLTSFVGDPFLSGEDLLKTVLVDFGVMSRDELAHGPLATRHELSATLLSFVESLAPLQASAVLVVDEAQSLPRDVLDQVRVLTEAGRDGQRLLSVILVGQPALTTLLRRTEHRDINQRVAVRCQLDPLPADEIAGYVSHRLHVAGTRPRVELDESALDRLFELSRGVPRVVNLLCDRALARGHETSAGVIGREIIDEAADDLDLGAPPSTARVLVARVGFAIFLLLFVLLGAAGAAWLFRDALARMLTSSR